MFARRPQGEHPQGPKDGGGVDGVSLAYGYTTKKILKKNFFYSISVKLS